MFEKKLSSTDKLLLERMYISGEHTVEYIADLLECSTQFVLDYIIRNDLNARMEKLDRNSSTQAIVYFVFTHGRKPSRSQPLDCTIPGFRVQLLTTSNSAKLNGLNIVGRAHDHSTNPNANFFTRPVFMNAYALAKEKNYVILIYDAFRLLARLSPNDRSTYLKLFAEDGVNIIDAKTNCSLSDGADQVNSYFIILSGRQRALKKVTSRQSYQASLYSKTHASRASKQAAIYSNMKRENLMPDIINVISDLKSAGKVSLQLIADELNRQEITSPRGRPWSKGTVNNILKKLEIDHRK